MTHFRTVWGALQVPATLPTEPKVVAVVVVLVVTTRHADRLGAYRTAGYATYQRSVDFGLVDFFPRRPPDVRII